MLIWAMIGAGTLIALFASLKLFAVVQSAPKRAPIPVGGGMVYETSASKIDEYVIEAEAWGPHLKRMPLFWIGCIATAVIVGLDYHFGHSRAGLMGLVVLGTLFAVADIAIPFIAIKRELSVRQDFVSTALLVLFTAMSGIVVIGSTAEVSTTTGAQTDVGVTSYQDDRKLLTLKQLERDSIPMNRGYSALNELAKATEEAADREGERKKCGEKCEKLKAEAKELRAQANEAGRKEKLTGEIEALKLKLAGGTSSNTRLDTDPLATAIEGMTAGVLTRDGVRRYGLTVLGLLLVVGVTVVWVVVGRDLKEEIDWELKHRGGIADATRANLGMPPKYTAPETPAGLLAPPAKTTAAESGITINVVNDMRRRFANDADLLETDRLFDELMERAEGGLVAFSDLYRAFRIVTLSNNHNAQFMTQPTMAQKLMTISQYRDDVRVTADGMIQGWILKPTDQWKMEKNNV